jgi:hypothetical protein
VLAEADCAADSSRTGQVTARDAHAAPGCRLTRIVRDVMGERIWRPSSENAIAGAIACAGGGMLCQERRESGVGNPSTGLVPAFSKLWDALGGKPGERWGGNPFVVTLTFRVGHGNIEKLPDLSSVLYQQVSHARGNQSQCLLRLLRAGQANYS